MTTTNDQVSQTVSENNDSPFTTPNPITTNDQTTDTIPRTTSVISTTSREIDTTSAVTDSGVIDITKPTTKMTDTHVDFTTLTSTSFSSSDVLENSTLSTTTLSQIDQTISKINEVDRISTVKINEQSPHPTESMALNTSLYSTTPTSDIYTKTQSTGSDDTVTSSTDSKLSTKTGHKMTEPNFISTDINHNVATTQITTPYTNVDDYQSSIDSDVLLQSSSTIHVESTIKPFTKKTLETNNATASVENKNTKTPENQRKLNSNYTGITLIQDEPQINTTTSISFLSTNSPTSTTDKGLVIHNMEKGYDENKTTPVGSKATKYPTEFTQTTQITGENTGTVTHTTTGYSYSATKSINPITTMLTSDSTDSITTQYNTQSESLNTMTTLPMELTPRLTSASSTDMETVNPTDLAKTLGGENTVFRSTTSKEVLIDEYSTTSGIDSETPVQHLIPGEMTSVRPADTDIPYIIDTTTKTIQEPDKLTAPSTIGVVTDVEAVTKPYTVTEYVTDRFINNEPDPTVTSLPDSKVDESITLPATFTESVNLENTLQTTYKIPEKTVIATTSKETIDIEAKTTVKVPNVEGATTTYIPRGDMGTTESLKYNDLTPVTEGGIDSSLTTDQRSLSTNTVINGDDVTLPSVSDKDPITIDTMKHEGVVTSATVTDIASSTFVPEIRTDTPGTVEYKGDITTPSFTEGGLYTLSTVKYRDNVSPVAVTEELLARTDSNIYGKQTHSTVTDINLGTTNSVKYGADENPTSITTDTELNKKDTQTSVTDDRLVTTETMQYSDGKTATVVTDLRLSTTETARQEDEVTGSPVTNVEEVTQYRDDLTTIRFTDSKTVTPEITSSDNSDTTAVVTFTTELPRYTDDLTSLPEVTEGASVTKYEEEKATVKNGDDVTSSYITDGRSVPTTTDKNTRVTSEFVTDQKIATTDTEKYIDELSTAYTIDNGAATTETEKSENSTPYSVTDNILSSDTTVYERDLVTTSVTEGSAIKTHGVEYGDDTSVNDDRSNTIKNVTNITPTSIAGTSYTTDTVKYDDDVTFTTSSIELGDIVTTTSKIDKQYGGVTVKYDLDATPTSTVGDKAGTTLSEKVTIVTPTSLTDNKLGSKNTVTDGDDDFATSVTEGLSISTDGKKVPTTTLKYGAGETSAFATEDLSSPTNTEKYGQDRTTAPVTTNYAVTTETVKYGGDVTAGYVTDGRSPTTDTDKYDTFTPTFIPDSKTVTMETETATDEITTTYIIDSETNITGTKKYVTDPTSSPTTDSSLYSSIDAMVIGDAVTASSVQASSATEVNTITPMSVAVSRSSTTEPRKYNDEITTTHGTDGNTIIKVTEKYDADVTPTYITDSKVDSTNTLIHGDGSTFFVTEGYITTTHSEKYGITTSSGTDESTPLITTNHYSTDKPPPPSVSVSSDRSATTDTVQYGTVTPTSVNGIITDELTVVTESKPVLDTKQYGADVTAASITDSNLSSAIYEDHVSTSVTRSKPITTDTGNDGADLTPATGGKSIGNDTGKYKLDLSTSKVTYGSSVTTTTIKLDADVTPPSFTDGRMGTSVTEQLEIVTQTSVADGRSVTGDTVKYDDEATKPITDSNENVTPTVVTDNGFETIGTEKYGLDLTTTTYIVTDINDKKRVTTNTPAGASVSVDTVKYGITTDSVSDDSSAFADNERKTTKNYGTVTSTFITENPLGTTNTVKYDDDKFTGSVTQSETITSGSVIYDNDLTKSTIIANIPTTKTETETESTNSVEYSIDDTTTTSVTDSKLKEKRTDTTAASITDDKSVTTESTNYSAHTTIIDGELAATGGKYGLMSSTSATDSITDTTVVINEQKHVTPTSITGYLTTDAENYSDDVRTTSVNDDSTVTTVNVQYVNDLHSTYVTGSEFPTTDTDRYENVTPATVTDGTSARTDSLNVNDANSTGIYSKTATTEYLKLTDATDPVAKTELFEYTSPQSLILDINTTTPKYVETTKTNTGDINMNTNTEQMTNNVTEIQREVTPESTDYPTETSSAVFGIKEMPEKQYTNTQKPTTLSGLTNNLSSDTVTTISSSSEFVNTETVAYSTEITNDVMQGTSNAPELRYTFSETSPESISTQHEDNILNTSTLPSLTSTQDNVQKSTFNDISSDVPSDAYTIESPVFTESQSNYHTTTTLQNIAESRTEQIATSTNSENMLTETSNASPSIDRTSSESSTVASSELTSTYSFTSDLDSPPTFISTEFSKDKTAFTSELVDSTNEEDLNTTFTPSYDYASTNSFSSYADKSITTTNKTTTSTESFVENSTILDSQRTTEIAITANDGVVNNDVSTTEEGDMLVQSTTSAIQLVTNDTTDDSNIFESTTDNSVLTTGSSSDTDVSPTDHEIVGISTQRASNTFAATTDISMSTLDFTATDISYADDTQVPNKTLQSTTRENDNNIVLTTETSKNVPSSKAQHTSTGISTSTESLSSRRKEVDISAWTDTTLITDMTSTETTVQSTEIKINIHCKINSHCPTNKACLNGVCENPCDMIWSGCTKKESCLVVNHAAVCVCDDTTGNLCSRKGRLIRCF